MLKNCLKEAALMGGSLASTGIDRPLKLVGKGSRSLVLAQF